MSRTSLALTAGGVLTLLWLLAATATPYSERAERLQRHSYSSEPVRTSTQAYRDAVAQRSNEVLQVRLQADRAVLASEGEAHGRSFDDISREMGPRAAAPFILDGESFCESVGARVADIQRGLDHPSFEKLCHPRAADAR